MSPLPTTQPRLRRWATALFAVVSAAFSSLGTAETVLWSESFDTAGVYDRWSISAGTWEMDVPVSGPGAAHSGSRCAGTILDGNYPPNADTRLVLNAPFVVPTAAQNPRLRFWQWYSTQNGSDTGYVEIKPVASTEWIRLSDDDYTSTGGGVWTRTALDLSAYAGQVVQVAFRFYSDGPAVEEAGWYVDDVAVVTGAPAFNNPEGFEGGLGDWSATRGTWEVGVPTSGPGAAFAGTKCAGTILGGNYLPECDSRLVSPVFTVPAAVQNPRLRFWQWYSTQNGYDYGYVEVKPVASTTWIRLSDDDYTSTGGGVWTRTALDLSDYAGQVVQVAFRFYSDGPAVEEAGWYVDDVAVVTGVPAFNNPEGFEGGLGDWSATRGTWEVGVPTSGPGAAFAGTKCAGTILGGNYLPECDSRLVSPLFTVPAAAQNPRLRFWQWYSTQNGYDYGYVEIKPMASTTWIRLSDDNYTGTGGGVWTRTAFDLSDYAGQTVQVAFHFASDGPAVEDTGWYVDDIEITSDTLVAIPSVYGHPELTPLNFTAQASGSNLVISLAPGAPAGANIDPVTGAFSWTPTEQQGPGVYDITVLVKLTGNNLNPVSSSTFTVNVVETNAPPVLDSIGNKTVNESSLLAFTATDTDLDNTNITNPTVITSARFDDLTFGTWTTYSAASNRNWQTEEFGERYAYVNGVGADVASDDWLISPPLNLNASNGEFLRFVSQRRYAGPDLTVLVSTNYPGTGNPNASTWTPLAPILPNADSSTDWTDSGILDLSASSGTAVRVAFRYTSTGTTTGTARLWRVDDIEIRGTQNVPPLQTLTYSLGAGAPSGASINPTTGQFTWTPTEGQGPGIHPVTIIVTDNGTNPANQSTSETIQITVGEVNQAPTLAVIPDKAVNELSLLTFTAVGSDNDLPANPLSYSLNVGAPTGAAINPSTGVFTWTPTEAQGPGTYPVTVRVTDSSPQAVNATSQSATRTFNVTAGEVNVAPVLAAITGKSVDEGTLLTFTASSTDADLPANTLTYSLIGAPSGASIHPASGVFSWTPAGTQGPLTYNFSVRVSDGALTHDQGVTIQVTESNTAPALTSIGAQTVNEGSLLNFTATATDTDLPANILTYSLIGAPSGASIDPTTGVFSWTPTEEQGGQPGVVNFTVQVSDGALTDNQTVSVTVNEVNRAPVLAYIPEKFVDGGTALGFTATATDADLPSNSLVYSLGAGAPSGASIHPGTGVLSWNPPPVVSDTHYTIRIVVSDNGNPVLNDFQDVSVLVRFVDDVIRWRRTKFGAEADDPAKEATVWGDYADPDKDGTGNLLEFMMVRNPMVPDENLGPKFRIENGKAILSYRETKLTDHGIYLLGNWSPDLKLWLYAGLEYVTVEDRGDHNLMEIRMPVNRQKQLFQRLELYRAY